jgi:hypothetical protein
MGSKPNFTLLDSRDAGTGLSGPSPADRSATASSRSAALQPSSRSAALRSAFCRALTGSLAAAAFISCISDGANKAGGEYLAEHGIIFKDSLLHVSLKGMPVDTFWSSDAIFPRQGEADARHLGDTILLAGRTGKFTAVPRMTFQITDTAMFDSLVAGDSTTLRLSLSFPKPNYSFAELRATVEAPGIRDSMAFEVAAWDSTDADIADDNWASKVSEWNGQFLFRNDTIAALPEPTSRDTIFIKVTSAYKADSIQANALPNLFKTMLAAPADRHFVHLHLTPVPGPAGPGPDGDSGAAMLRLGGWMGDGSFTLTKGPLLLFGKTATATAGSDKNRLRAMAVPGTTVRAVDYSLRYGGSRTDMLTEKQRGLHLILDRAALFDSIDAALRRDGKPFQPRSTSGEFDLSYFVPFAKMTLPVDSVILDGGFPLEMNMATETDSLLGDDQGGFQVDTISLGAAKPLWLTSEIGRPEVIKETISLGYEAFNGDLRRVILQFSSRDSSYKNDTLYIATGETKNWIANPNTISSISMTLTAGSSTLTVRNYLSFHRIAENNDFRDPATGERITDIMKLVPHYLKPGDTSFTLRATTGFQRLMNRALSGTKRHQSFIIQPPARPAVDTLVTVNDVNVRVTIPYPILSVIPPKLTNGRLTVDVELYLFPLKAR